MADFPWTAVVSVAGTTIILTVLARNRDRLLRLSRAFEWAGALALLGALGLLIAVSPGIGLAMVGALLLMSLLTQLVSRPSRLKTTPADERAVSVWRDEVELLASLGWDFGGGWVLNLGRASPPFVSMIRPHDGTQASMLGTAPQGGVISIETMLDDGRGLMVTLRRKSTQLKPPWMFRQELPGLSLEELIRAHDESLFILETRGIRASGSFEGTAIEFDLATSAKQQRHTRRRLWLAAVAPLFVTFAASRRLRLSEQSDLDRQIDRYRRAIGTEPALSARPHRS